MRVKSVNVVHVSSGIKRTKTAGSVLILAVGYRCQVEGVCPQVVRSSEHIEERWVAKDEFLELDFGDDGGFHLEVVKRA